LFPGRKDDLVRKEIREFLDWVYEQAVREKGKNPGQTTNKAREHLRAVMGLDPKPGSSVMWRADST